VAGSILGAVFLEILPEAINQFGNRTDLAFYGFIALAMIEWLIGHHHRSERAFGILVGVTIILMVSFAEFPARRSQNR
jgi:hypothetical protein